jgi:uncharacterized protein YlxW (UPF0749 family)
MAYGSVESQPRQTGWTGSASQNRRFIMIGLATISACCLMALIASDKRVELVEEADGLELNAYLSSTQAADFKNLRNEQASLEAEVDSLEKRERQMQPEDTKASQTYTLCQLFQQCYNTSAPLDPDVMSHGAHA